MQHRVEGRKLIIEINLDERDGETENGNTRVASTHGWVQVEKDVSLSLNVIKKERARR
jgi:hypothetical protein